MPRRWCGSFFAWLQRRPVAPQERWAGKEGLNPVEIIARLISDFFDGRSESACGVFYLRGHGETGGVGGVRVNSAEDKEQPTGPRRKADKDEPLTADNLGTESSGHCYIDVIPRRRRACSHSAAIEKRPQASTADARYVSARGKVLAIVCVQGPLVHRSSANDSGVDRCRLRRWRCGGGRGRVGWGEGIGWEDYHRRFAGGCIIKWVRAKSMSVG